MADLIITIPDSKLPLIVDWVDSRTNDGIINGWTNAQYALWVSDYLKSRLRNDILSFQQQSYLLTFIFDDPTVV